MRSMFWMIAAMGVIAAAGCTGKSKTGESKGGPGDSSAVKTAIIDSLRRDSTMADTGDTADDFDTLEPDSISIE